MRIFFAQNFYERLSVDLSTFRILSLCSGVGGIELGFKLAEPTARTVCYVEIEAFACEILARRMEEKRLDAAPIWSNLKTFDGKPWRGVVDCITGGYPCQPFSVAGKKLGSEDPRHLWPDIKRLIGEIQPPICFFENVSNHLRVGFEEVANDLQRLGYKVKAGLFTAAEVGAPHKEKDCSSWPTVIVSDHLCNPTETPQRWKERAQQKKIEGINLHKPLRIVAQESWPTVVSSDASMGAIISPNDTYTKNASGTFRKINKNGKDGSLGLARTVKMWPTVRSSSANGPCQNEIKNSNPKVRLEVEIQNWATPQARDWKDGNAKNQTPTNSILGRQAPRIMNAGTESKLTLNPQFTEWLMGWPIGWTKSELAETEWFRWLQLMRGELLRMECILQRTIN